MSVSAHIFLEGATNRDMEDLTIGPDGEGGYDLYLGDIGNNNDHVDSFVIYKFKEPSMEQLR